MRNVETIDFIALDDAGLGVTAGMVVAIRRTRCVTSVVVGSGVLEEEPREARLSGDVWVFSPEQASALGSALLRAADDASPDPCADTREDNDGMFD